MQSNAFAPPRTGAAAAAAAPGLAQGFQATAKHLQKLKKKIILNFESNCMRKDAVSEPYSCGAAWQCRAYGTSRPAQAAGGT